MGSCKMAAANVHLVKVLKKKNAGLYRTAARPVWWCQKASLVLGRAGLPWEWPQRSSVALKRGVLGMLPLLQRCLMEGVYFSAIKTNLSPLFLILVRKHTLLIEELGLDNLLRSFLESYRGRARKEVENVLFFCYHTTYFCCQNTTKK